MQDLKHRILNNTALPFISNASPIDPRPRFISGSSNILTSNKGYLERRPGFPVYTADNYSTDTIRRFFTWRRWAADFYVMLVEVEGAATKVYKQKVGTDATFAIAQTDSSSTEPFDFAVANNHVYFCNGTLMNKYDGTTVTNWGITAPASAVSTAVGGTGLTAVAGYKYVIAWENSGTGEYSSISPYMTSRVIPSNETVTITGNTTADTQVDKVRVWRTTDGGTRYFEHPSSPVTYANWVASGLADSTADAALIIANEAAPQDQNDRPPASKGVVFFAGRLWTFAGDKVYFSAREELKRTQGLGVSAFPPDNFFPFGAEITALSVTQDALLVHAPPVIYRITGDTRDTFTRDVLASRAGARNRAAVFSTGRISAWLDYTNTVRITDGLSIQEISLPIRDQLASVSHSNSAIAIHDDGVRHWILLIAAGTGNLYVFDQDTNQWLPPWAIDNMESIFSGETAAGTVKLFLGRGGKPLAMSTSDWRDEGTAYTATAQTSLIEITGEPDNLGAVRHVAIERNSVANSAVSLLTDEDPAGASYTAITSNTADPHARTQGTNLVEKLYYTDSGPFARRASVKLDWSAANSNFKTYGIDMAYEETDQ